MPLRKQYHFRPSEKGLLAKVKTFFFTVDPNTEHYKEESEFLGEQGFTLYVDITCAKHQDKFLFQAISTKEPEVDANRDVTRFDLDRCQRLTESEVKAKLMTMVPDKVDRVMGIFALTRA